MRNLIFCTALIVSLSAFANELDQPYEAMMQFYRENPVTEAKEVALEFLPMAIAENDPYYLVKTYFLLGYLASHTDDYGNAIHYYLEGARIAEKSDEVDIRTTLIYIYKNLGWILGDYKHYELAHKFINQGLAVATELDDQDQIRGLLNNRIHELLEEEKYHKALHQIDSLHSLFDLEGIKLLEMKNKAGIAYKNTGRLPKAISHYQFIIDNGKEVSKNIYAIALFNTGNIYYEGKLYPEALDFYEDAIEVAKVEGLNNLLFKSFEKVGKTYLAREDYKNATHYLKEAEHLDQVIEDLDPDTYTVYEKLSKVYEEMGEFEQALYYQDIYSERLKKFIAEQEKLKALNRKYNMELLTQKYLDVLAIDEERRKLERIMIFGLGGIIVLFIILVGIYYKFYHYKSVSYQVHGRVAQKP